MSLNSRYDQEALRANEKVFSEQNFALGKKLRDGKINLVQHANVALSIINQHNKRVSRIMNGEVLEDSGQK